MTLTRAALVIAAFATSGCDCKPSCFFTPITGPGEINRNPGLVGRPYTIKLPVPGNSSSCGPVTFASSVAARVVDPNNAAVTSTVALPLDGMSAPAEVTFTPQLPGPYHLSARFEPSFGLVQTDVWIASDRSDAGVSSLPVPYECARWDRLGDEVFCINPDAGALAVIVDGGVAMTVPAYDFALAPELSGVWVMAAGDGASFDEVQFHWLDGGTLSLMNQISIDETCSSANNCSVQPCGPLSCVPGVNYMEDARVIDRAGTALVLFPPNYGYANLDLDAGEVRLRQGGALLASLDQVPTTPFAQWGPADAVAVGGATAFGNALCILPFDGGNDCNSSVGVPGGATLDGVWVFNATASGTGTLDGLGVPAAGGPVFLHVSVSPPDAPSQWPAPDTAPHWTTQGGLMVLGSRGGEVAFDFYRLDLSDATWWGVDSKRLWKWSAATGRLTWVDR